MAPKLQLPKLTEVLIQVHKSGILELRLNTPENLNSFGPTKYHELIEGFNYAKANKDIKAVLVSANGRFFSSGAALSGDRMTANKDQQGVNSPATKYVDCLIDFPKLAVCALNGPAYGIAVTTLPLFDLVYAAPDVTLTTPFSRIGISLEGVSSLLFPPTFGPSLTTRLLYLAETVPIAELMHSGLFAEVLPKETIADVVREKVEKRLEDLAVGSIVASKSMVRAPAIRKLWHETNHAEMRLVGERVQSQEHRDAITRFQAKRAAGKKAAKL